MNEEIRKMVDAKSSADAIKKKAIQSGMTILRDDGIKKICQGLTTLEEVLRVSEME